MIATFRLQGPLTRYGLDRSKGAYVGTSTQELRSSIDRVRRDPRFRAAVVLVNSPGGAVDGSVELHDAFAALAQKMPVVAHIDGLAASAALMVIAPIPRITATRGSLIGSVGTYTVVIDTSRLMEKLGVEVIPISTSELKVAGLPGTPLTESQRQYLSRVVADAQRNFGDALAAGRKLNAAQLQRVSTGEVWSARSALQLRLIDSIATADEALAPLIGNAVSPVFVEFRERQPSSPPPREIVRRVPGGGTSIHVHG